MAYFYTFRGVGEHGDVGNFDDINYDMFDAMRAHQKVEFVTEDPVICCLYFDKFVDCLVNSLKRKNVPFGKYRLIDYFRRVEFQHRGSPHCHVLLWLENATTTL